MERPPSFHGSELGSGTGASPFEFTFLLVPCICSGHICLPIGCLAEEVRCISLWLWAPTHLFQTYPLLDQADHSAVRCSRRVDPGHVETLRRAVVFDIPLHLLAFSLPLLTQSLHVGMLLLLFLFRGLNFGFWFRGGIVFPWKCIIFQLPEVFSSQSGTKDLPKILRVCWRVKACLCVLMSESM